MFNLMTKKRVAKIERKTTETDIRLELVVDGTGLASVQTGIPFLDHMLTLFALHGFFDLDIKAKGDVDVDYHHTVEDVGIALGEAFRKALGEKRRLRRYGFFVLPMDESLARVVVDFSNRPVFVYNIDHHNRCIRDFNLSLLKEYFHAFAYHAGATLHMTLEYGEEPHHIAEALFKCFGRALDAATQIDSRLKGGLPSTKGSLS